MKGSWLRRFTNRILHILARFLPGATTVRPALHRLRGVKIGEHVFIGDDVYLENEYPSCVEIHSGAQISVRAVILAHTGGPGKVVIEKNVFIGPNTVLATSRDRTLRVGEGAVIGAGVVITKDVAAHVFVANSAATPMAIVLDRDNNPRWSPLHRMVPGSSDLPAGLIDRDQVRNSVFRAIERVRELSLSDRPLPCDESAVLLGKDSALDSMSYVNFVVALQEEVERISDRPVDVAGTLGSLKTHMLLICTAGQLIDYLYMVLQNGPLS